MLEYTDMAPPSERSFSFFADTGLKYLIKHCHGVSILIQILKLTLNDWEKKIYLRMKLTSGPRNRPMCLIYERNCHCEHIWQQNVEMSLYIRIMHKFETLENQFQSITYLRLRVLVGVSELLSQSIHRKESLIKH